jgi:hypothetical protein
MTNIYGFMVTGISQGERFAHTEDSDTSLETITNSVLNYLENYESEDDKVLCIFQIDLDTGDMKQLQNRAQLETLLDERRNQEQEDALEKSDYEEHNTLHKTGTGCV